VTKADAWGWITVLLIVSFLFGSILSSVAAWYYKRESERKQQERREKLARGKSKGRKRDGSITESASATALNDSILSDTSSDVASSQSSTPKPRR
jgi:DNA invertase Pin-like site-specific DNA recombinase